MRTRVSTKLYEKGAVSCVPLGRSRFKSLAKDYRYFTSIVDAFSSFWVVLFSFMSVLIKRLASKHQSRYPWTT